MLTTFLATSESYSLEEFLGGIHAPFPASQNIHELRYIRRDAPSEVGSSASHLENLYPIPVPSQEVNGDDFSPDLFVDGVEVLPSQVASAFVLSGVKLRELDPVESNVIGPR